MAAQVDGNHILYHYLEKDLRDHDIWLFQMLTARLFTALGIWFDPKTYARCPILLPFAVRDPSCRKRKATDIEAWGAPNSKGYFRDDNTLIKNLPKTLAIEAPKNLLYHGRTLGRGFVAAHVWRVSDGGYSSRDADTNSFIPNLVWLPQQVAKLTDREGSFAQIYLQALAVKIYRREKVEAHLGPAVNRAWGKLPEPVGIPTNGLPAITELAFFSYRDQFVSKRISVIRSVAEAVRAVLTERPITGKVCCSRYTAGLPAIDRDELRLLLGCLAPLIDASQGRAVPCK